MCFFISYLVYSQDDDEEESIYREYREENYRLSIELQDAHRNIEMTEEQITSLKQTVLELEYALKREKEYNGPSNRVNAEYLVNVMRKFLMTDDPKERAESIAIVTQVLHLLPDECRAITDKWAVKTKSRGWFGWGAEPGQPGPSSAPSVAGTDRTGSNSSEDEALAAGQGAFFMR
jgi:hypothetical protein